MVMKVRFFKYKYNKINKLAMRQTPEEKSFHPQKTSRMLLRILGSKTRLAFN